MPIVRIEYPNPLPTEQADYVKQNELIESRFLDVNGAPFPVSGSNIVQGAVFQIGGTIYQATADTAITGVASDYVKLTPSLDGSICAAAFVADLTGVTWSKVYNGYYDVGGNLYVYNQFNLNLLGTLTDVNTIIEKIANAIVNHFGSSFVYELYKVGNSFSMPGAGTYPRFAKLTETRVAFIDQNVLLTTYDWDGETWSQVGNTLNLAGMVHPSITGLTSSTIALINSGDQLRTYSFDGADWAQVGNTLATSNMTSPEITALSNTRVAILNPQDNKLQAYDWDGTDWTTEGNSYTFGAAISDSSITSLSSTRVAVAIGNSDIIEALDFDGTNWAIIGTSIGRTMTFPSIAALTDELVIIVDSNTVKLNAYRFDGAKWWKLETEIDLTGIGYSGMCAITEHKIVLADNGLDIMTTYSLTRFVVKQ